MDFKCQVEAISQLNMLSEIRRQSIVIEGHYGVGKSYLARQYARMVGVSDFQIVKPKVDEIRQSIEECIKVSSPVVLCIEDLDYGVVAASYALLKFLEEPIPNVYIVVTCSDVHNIPDTIVSRSTVVTISPPTDDDLSLYGRTTKSDSYAKIKDTPLWKCARTFHDVSCLLDMTDEEVNYILSLSSILEFKDNISSIVWKLGHYENNKETPVETVIRYISLCSNSPFISMCGIECIRDLSTGRVAAHAALSKFAFNIKYCE